MTVRQESARVARLGPYRIDLKTWEVTGGGDTVRLTEKAFLVLDALLERPGEAVTRDELRERLWPDGTVVDFDNNLNTAVATLRSAFGDTAKSQRYIQTLPRLGYRLSADVRLEPASGRAQGEAGVPAGRARWRWALAIALAAIAWVAASWSIQHRLASPSADQPPATRTSAGVQAPQGDQARQVWRRGLYLRGREASGDPGRALEAFRKAAAQEPGFAPAWVKVAETLSEMSFAQTIDTRAGLVEAREAAKRALSLDSASPAAHRILALADLHLDRDFPSAARGIETALRLDPHDGQGYLAAATVLSMIGRNEEAVETARRAVELDPASYLLKADLAFFMVAARQYAEAKAMCQEALMVEPRYISALSFRMIASERLGQWDEAASTARRIMEVRGASGEQLRSFDRLDPQSALSHFRRWELQAMLSQTNQPSVFLARKHASLHQTDEAFRLLERAYEQQEPWLLYLNGYAQFADLRNDHRFQALVARLSFPSPSAPEFESLVGYLEELD